MFNHDLPCQQVPYYLQSALDRAIDEFGRRQAQIANSGGKKTLYQLNSEKIHRTRELNFINSIAQVQAGLDKYRADAAGMSIDALEDESHDSAILGKNLRAVGKTKPDDRVDAHAIVSGAHSLAARVRGVMAELGIRVDDPDNGMWMPRRTKDTPHWAFPKCPPHSRIHRFNYYFWIQSQLLNLSNEVDFRRVLRDIADDLHQNYQPGYVMMKKGQGLPEDDL